MTEDQIKHMVNRFLSWKLPDSFNPDGGISFKRTFNDHMAPPSRHEPSGTNLLDATQADAMVRYMLEGMPSAIPPLAWDAYANRSYEPVETLARVIYDGFPDPLPEPKPDWVPGGNSIMQDNARVEARRQMRQAGHVDGARK